MYNFVVSICFSDFNTCFFSVSSLTLQSSVQEVCVIVEQQFTRLQAAVEEARKGAAEVLEGEQRQALRQAEGIQAHLEQRRTELMKTLAQMNKLSKNKSDVDFLQVQHKINI